MHTLMKVIYNMALVRDFRLEIAFPEIFGFEHKPMFKRVRRPLVAYYDQHFVHSISGVIRLERESITLKDVKEFLEKYLNE